MFRSPTASFDRLLDKCTSQLLLEPDWSSILMLCDAIRGGDVPPKYAVSAIKKKFYHENPHVQLFSLQVMESCVKNCGSLVHEEIATKQFMEELRELVKRTNDDNIKQKILEMIQNWGMAFRNSQKYRITTDTLNLMKAEGWEFPPIREAEAMFEADVAPDWAEGEVCHRCRMAFGLVNRQHHCRACGQVFCSKCSAKSCVLPKFGIEKEVRVCDSCFDEYGPKESSSSSTPTSTSPVKTAGKRQQQQGHPHRGQRGGRGDLPAEYLSSSLAQQPQSPAPKSGKSEAEIKEEEELQLALALSVSEAEEKEKYKLKSTRDILASIGNKDNSSPAEIKTSSDVKATTNDDDVAPELMRYLNRDYWEQKEKEKERDAAAAAAAASAAATSPSLTSSAPLAGGGAAAAGGQQGTKSQEDLYKEQLSATAAMASSPHHAAAPAAAGPAAAGPAAVAPMMNSKSDEELNEFVMTLRTQVEIFVNRMKSNSSRGRSIANDSSVQTLFMNTMAMHSQLLKNIQEQEDKRVHYEGLQDKLTQMRDARAALEALREEERERKRREAEEAERIRQIQMREKLEVMRKKKQEYLQYQRQLALQRMQEQEREMMLRQEQFKQQQLGAPPQAMAYAMGGAAPPAGPGGVPQMFPPQQQGGAPQYGAYPAPAGAPLHVSQQPGAPASNGSYEASYHHAMMAASNGTDGGMAGAPPSSGAPVTSAPQQGPGGLQQQQPSTSSPYAMHSLASALPSQPQQQQQPGAGHPSQQQMHQGGVNPQFHQQPMVNPMTMQQQQMGAPPTQQQQMGGPQTQPIPQDPALQYQSEGSLISFD